MKARNQVTSSRPGASFFRRLKLKVDSETKPSMLAPTNGKNNSFEIAPIALLVIALFDKIWLF